MEYRTEKNIYTTWEELTISNDFLFGKVMQDAELCKELLQRILPDLNIDRIVYPELQKTISLDLDAKSIRLDVYVKDGRGTIYDIEMQVIDTKELPKRTRYYQSIIDLQLIDKGELYNKLKPCFIIFICPFDPFQKGRHIYTFENLCKEDKTLSLNDGMTKIFLNAKGTQDDVSQQLHAFLDYVAGKESEDLFVQKLKKAVKEAKKNRNWRLEFMTLLMRDQENIEKGRMEGRMEGIEAIILDNLEEGISKERILIKLQKLFALNQEEAEQYYKKFSQ